MLEMLALSGQCSKIKQIDCTVWYISAFCLQTFYLM